MLNLNQFKLPNSQCIWSFSIVGKQLTIDLDTGSNIIYSDYTDQLNILVDETWLKTNAKLHYSKVAEVYYYTGKLSFTAKIPSFKEGILEFKECNEAGQCGILNNIRFYHSQSGWSFKDVTNNLEGN